MCWCPDVIHCVLVHSCDALCSDVCDALCDDAISQHRLTCRCLTLARLPLSCSFRVSNSCLVTRRSVYFYVSVCLPASVCLCLCLCLSVCLSVCVCVSVSTSVCLCVCLCVGLFIVPYPLVSTLICLFFASPSFN